VRARVTEDEVGTIADSYNSTVESLRQIVTQVKAVAGQVTTTAEQNDVAVQKLATEALLQAEKIEASLAQLESMNQAVRDLTEQAQAAQQAVIATTITVESSDRKMTRAVEGMVTIRETVAETTRKMEDLEDASQRISQVIRLIGGFAAQTHMLAMKASIEAARAGDRGEGFAVIADEVRTLAGRSAQATADVEAIINSIRIATQDVLGAMSAENKQVEKEMELVDDTRSSLNQITAASAQVNQLVMAIAQTTRDQTQTSDAASQTITDVARLVRQTSVEANQVSETFQDLLKAAQALQSEVSRFKVQ
jgi:methyl-accepting chemotaxis protein PixJ